jgi:hypothetical protein
MKDSTVLLIKDIFNIEYIFDMKSHTFFYVKDPYIHGPSTAQAVYYKHDKEIYLVGLKKRYTESELIRVLNLLVFA